MLLHLPLVHDGKSSCDDTGESEDADENDLRIHSVGETQPNESRLSCGADLKCSQTEFYNTVRQDVNRTR